MNVMGIIYFFGIFPMVMIGLCVALHTAERHEEGEDHV